ncbi:TonB-dependent receptor [Sphingomonas sp. ASV193]|uniref:TonB-dependent receptor n=1 Tax=Sphingomonas sp. ASV193 TaxID=3144405 RepID=UPI0032E8CBCE
MGVSALALAAPQAALAQAQAPTPPVADPNAPVSDPTATPAEASAQKEIVVTGIRGSLRKSMDIKKNAQGVVDAISAEEIGKFPDTNLAESLQRITGVSIDRSSGEGSTVTVRGFGPEFNLVLLDGRQMPASGLGDCCSAPASRSFDFANLASEGIAAVEVYKSGRASLPTGGIGSAINIVTPRPLDRPGLRGSFSVKGVYDTSRFRGLPITPEVSGIFSDTFADNRIGILFTGSYQQRKASVSQFSAGWREGYSGAENNWESLAQPGDPRYANITNRPGPTDIYQVPQNAGYDFTNLTRTRINGQLVLQARPVDNLTATVDYVYSQNTIDARTNSIGVWFNGNDTTSSWTDGPAAGPLFYSEHFGQGENKDLAITGAVAKNRSINRSLGGNLAWKANGLRLTLDAHHSTAESKPTSPYGSNIAVGTAIYGVQNQKIDFTSDMPVISVSMYPGSEVTASNIRPAGNAFRNAYMKDTINEVAFRGGYDFDSSFIKSLDFGATYTENKVRSAYGFIQNDTWGGTLSAANTPDTLFTPTPLPPDLAGMSGSNNPAIIPGYFQIDTNGLIQLLNEKIGICSATTGPAGSCLAAYTVDRRIKERTLAPYIQSTSSFDLLGNQANLRLGVRYETTRVSSTALTGVPGGTRFTGGNEISILQGSGSQFLTTKGRYHNWLPAIDFDMSPMRNVKLRASYSHTITRADYASLAGGLTVNSPARPDGGGTGGSGNPNLIPYKSKNIDLSAEWYYGASSYVSVGYFHKTVSNFIANTTTQQPAFGLTNPAKGQAYLAAVAALGPNASFADILAYVQTHFPSAFSPGPNASDPYTGGGILGLASDPALIFTLTTPGNSDRVAHVHGFEFAVQHNFWDTGFGTILNYTIVKSDTKFDNTLEYRTTQFAVPGASNSANAVLYYDKNGLQARIAYNWRQGFLAGYGFDPFYVNSYGQFDASASLEVRKGFTIFADGINITGADRKGHMRNANIVYFAQPGHPRYSLGFRYNF